jgi:hypothetical protein
MTRQEMLDRVDSLMIYSKDYEVIKTLFTLEDKLFVKIFEEILQGNIFFSDFERIFSDESYANMIKNNFQEQEKLRIEILRLSQFRKDISSILDPSLSRLAITNSISGTKIDNLYESEKTKTINNQLYQLLDTIPSDNDLVRASKLRIYRKIESGEISEDDFLLFIRDYLVPVSFEHQLLDKSDVNFMKENNITEDQMKKIKALSLFVKREDM